MDVFILFGIATFIVLAFVAKASQLVHGAITCEGLILIGTNLRIK